MKMRSFIVAVAALSFATVALATGAAAETKIVNISKKYSKLGLEAICTREGGSSYGVTGGSYGCTKGNNTVECQKDGTCKGYISGLYAPASTGGSNHWGGSAELLLEMQSAPSQQ